MSPEAQRIAIAESLGFYVHREGDVVYVSKDPKPNWDHRVYQSCPMPRYLEDLNAMHQAEKTLPDFAHYARWLKWVSIGLHQIIPKEKWKIVHCTAAQRAEAYLRTIGKWKD